MSRRRHESYISPCVKWTLFIFNFLFWFFGLLILAVATYGMYFTAVDLHGKENLETLYILFTDLSAVFLCFGAVIFFVSYTGCIGALRENLCLLKFYFWSLTIILILELLLAIACIVFPWKSRQIVQSIVTTSFVKDYDDSRNKQNLVDFLQETLGCCGMSDEGYRDWGNNMYFHCNVSSPSVQKCGVPPSCCIDFGVQRNLMCGYGMQEKEEPDASDFIYTQGCVQALIMTMESNLYVAAGIIFAITLFQMYVTHQARSLMDQISLQRARWY